MSVRGLRGAAVDADDRGMKRLMSSLVIALFVAAPAQASEDEVEKDTAPAAERCSRDGFSRIFLAYRDRSLYALAPGGDFETAAEGWTLDPGATVVDESSPILLGAALGGSSLELAPGAAATTPPICVERGFRHMRFVARSAGTGRAAVRVDVLHRSDRVKRRARIGVREGWRVTRKVSLSQGQFRVRKGHATTVRLRFTALGGPVRVDDVYVDPRFRR
jgi:hypothetical protein